AARGERPGPPRDARPAGAGAQVRLLDRERPREAPVGLVERAEPLADLAAREVGLGALRAERDGASDRLLGLLAPSALEQRHGASGVQPRIARRRREPLIDGRERVARVLRGA